MPWLGRLVVRLGGDIAVIEISVFYSLKVEVWMTAAFTCVTAGICGGGCASNLWGCATSSTLI